MNIKPSSMNVGTMTTWNFQVGFSYECHYEVKGNGVWEFIGRTKGTTTRQLGYDHTDFSECLLGSLEVMKNDDIVVGVQRQARGHAHSACVVTSLPPDPSFPRIFLT